MQATTNKLNACYLQENCSADWSMIHVFDSIDSTSSWLKQQSTPRTVCLAESQTQGRGRNGHHWHSPSAENVYLSFSWDFIKTPKHLPLLSLWIGITIAETIERLGVRNHGIKWPNDLYWQQKKMGGILIETSSASSEVIVGIGINANVTTTDQPWTSLSEACGDVIDRNAFVLILLDSLYYAMEAFETLSAVELQERWKKWDLIRDKIVTFQCQGESREGHAQGIDDFGRLLVRSDQGQVTAFNTSISQVRWR